MPVERTTGLDSVRFDQLVAMVEERVQWNARTGRPKALTVRQAVKATLIYFKNNVTEEVIAKLMFVDQSTISRTISTVERLIGQVLADEVPDLAETTRGTTTVIDSSLTPCWSWRAHPTLYSGKHRTTGHNHQFVTTLDGRLVHISDPLPGTVHDTNAARQSGIFNILDPADMLGDKGYLGTRIITPIRKPAGGALLTWQKQFNTDINRRRCVAERVIANFKAWPVPHRLPPPPTTYKTAFTAARALYFYSQN